MTHLRILSREANLIQFVLPRDHSSSVVGDGSERDALDKQISKGMFADQDNRTREAVSPCRADLQIKRQRRWQKGQERRDRKGYLQEICCSRGASPTDFVTEPPFSLQELHYGWLIHGQVTFLWRLPQIHQHDRWGVGEEGSACSSQSWILDSSHHLIDLLSNSGILSLKNQ